MSDGCVYLNPVAKPTKPQRPYLPRLRIGAAVRIAQYPNLFTDSAAFLADLVEALKPAVPTATFPYFDKQFGRYMSTPASPELRARMLAESDAVVLAYGHCGSCTSGVVHDGVLLAHVGMPVAVLVTERFRDEAEFLARALGLPGLPFVFLPHPVAGQDAAYHRALAQAIAPLVLSALTQGQSSDATRILQDNRVAAA
ncbi:MAG: hypothetical protein ABW034_24045 [Steroidobacteraceae bacterium]